MCHSSSALGVELYLRQRELKKKEGGYGGEQLYL
jgi:hypothetical protein